MLRTFFTHLFCRARLGLLRSLTALPSLLCLAGALFLTQGAALAQHTVTIIDHRSGSVYGNSSDTSGNNSSGPGTNNLLQITATGVVDGHASGAERSTGTVSDNKVANYGNVGSNSSEFAIYGGKSNNGSANSNTVEINSGTVLGMVAGGWAGANSANNTISNNAVTITGGTVEGSIYGAFEFGTVFAHTVENNEVTINGVTVIGKEINGATSSFNNTNNTVTITDGNITTDKIFGGQSTDGASLNNTVTITGGIIKTNDLYGGYTSNSVTTSMNQVFISDADIQGAVNGAYSMSGTVTNNIVTISDSNISGDIYGGDGLHNTNAATLNSVSITGGTIHGNVTGAQNREGTAKNNTVTMTDVNMEGDVSGAYGKVSQNITVHSQDNTVTITGSTIKGTVSGGTGTNPHNNTVNIIDSTIIGKIYGSCYTDGSSSSSAQAINNTVTISGTSDLSQAEVYGGYAQTRNAFTGNVLNMEDDVIVKSAGNFAEINFNYNTGESHIKTLNTTANITTGGITLNAGTNDINFTGVIQGSGSMTWTGTGVLTLSNANTYSGITTINGGQLIVTGSLGNGNYAKNITNNSTNALVFDTNKNQTLAGVISGSAIASGTPGLIKDGPNTLILTAANTYTGDTIVNAGTLQLGNGASTGSIKGNIVNNANVAFNRSDAVTYAGVISGTGTVTKLGNNTLTLSGANTYTGATSITNGQLIVTGTLGAGNVYTGDIYDNGSSSVEFNQTQAQTLAGVISGSKGLIKKGANNLTLTGANTYSGVTELQQGTITLAGGTGKISNSLIIYGGTTLDSFNGVQVSLVNLNVKNTGIGEATVIGDLFLNNATMKFDVDLGIGNEDVMLNVINSGAAAVDISNAKVEVYLTHDPSNHLPIGPGEHIVLIASDAPILGTPAESRAVATRGVSLRYNLETGVKDNPNELWLYWPDGGGGGGGGDGGGGDIVTVIPEMEDPVSGFLTGSMLLNQTGDRVARRDLDEAVCAAGRAGAKGYGLFCDVAGGQSHYDSLSNISLSSLSVIGGLSRCMSAFGGTLTGGAFVEYGTGSYKSALSLHEAEPVHGSGNLDHVGGGVLGRMSFRNFASGRDYIDGSFRVGNLINKYNSDLCDARENAAGYTSSAAYYGLHIGIGRIWNLRNHASLDVYGKYFWTQQHGDAVTFTTGDPVVFDSINSHRLRVGGRYNLASLTRAGSYFGVAWEHEFDAKAHATTFGYDIRPVSLAGDTGIAEIGITWKPAANHGFYADLNLQGTIGKRQGATAGLLVGRNF